MHVDPSNTVLATTTVEGVDGSIFDMPVAWTRVVGLGRVFYSSLAHSLDVVAAPGPLRLATRGICWAARQDHLLDGS